MTTDQIYLTAIREGYYSLQIGASPYDDYETVTEAERDIRRFGTSYLLTDLDGSKTRITLE